MVQPTQSRPHQPVLGPYYQRHLHHLFLRQLPAAHAFAPLKVQSSLRLFSPSGCKISIEMMKEIEIERTIRAKKAANCSHLKGRCSKNIFVASMHE